MRTTTGWLGSRLASALLVSALALGGCGDDAPATGQFTGQWQYTSGNQIVTCPGFQPLTEQLTGTLSINAGTDAPLVSVEAGAGCATKMDINGTVATIRSGQMCTEISGATTVTITYQGGTFAVNGTTGTLSANGTANVNQAGQTVACTFSLMAGLAKIGK